MFDSPDSRPHDIMKIIKDITRGIVFPYNFIELLKLRNWKFEIKNRQQRLERGWSDKDCWGAGEHILEITSGMLKKLEEEQNPVDWEHYFEANYRNIKKYKYTSLAEVANDIDELLNFERSNARHEYNVTERLKIERRLYKRASRALHFVADNFGMLWW